MLINMAFIKATNGLFYYAIDYIAAVEARVSVILVSTPALAEAVRRRFPEATVHVTGAWRTMRAVVAAARRGEMVFTPSSHPIPCCDRQIVVVHDSFPFDGFRGAAKAMLFFAALRSSRAKAGYINVADAWAFLRRGGVPQECLRSMPNRFPSPSRPRLTGQVTLSAVPVVGLFGTDSPKKNYDRLFCAVREGAPTSPVTFLLYGQANAYAAGVCARFPELNIKIIDSDRTELEDFVRSVDIVASAAMREGFGRPIALALASGVPAWIVDAPVFREFYGGAATFHADPGLLGAALAALRPGDVLARPALADAAGAEKAFLDGVAWLIAKDMCRP
jgi:hypothetical protein